MEHIIHRILPCRHSIDVEPARRIVRTRVHRNLDTLFDRIVRGGKGLCSTDLRPSSIPALTPITAGPKAVVVVGFWLKSLGVDFDGVVDVTSRDRLARIGDVCKVLCGGNLPCDTGFGRVGAVDVAVLVDAWWNRARPQDHGIAARITGCNAMSKGEGCWRREGAGVESGRVADGVLGEVRGRGEVVEVGEGKRKEDGKEGCLETPDLEHCDVGEGGGEEGRPPRGVRVRRARGRAGAAKGPQWRRE